MTSKIGKADKVEVYCSEFGRYAYDVRRGDRTAYGKLEPRPGSPHYESAEVVDAVGAFAAWMKALSLYRYWKEARDAARLLQLKEQGEPIGAEQVKACRLAARPLTRRANELDAALKEAAEEYGDLGVGQDIETIVIKLGNLQNWIRFDHQLWEWHHQGRPDEPLPAHITDGLELDGRSVKESTVGIRQVHDMVEAISHKLYQGRLVVNATSMYEAIVIGAALVLQRGKLHLRLCSGCSTLFVSKRPDAETCSPRCRQRKKSRTPA